MWEKYGVFLNFQPIRNLSEKASSMSKALLVFLLSRYPKINWEVNEGIFKAVASRGTLFSICI